MAGSEMSFLGGVSAFSTCVLLTLQINAGVITQMIMDESVLGPPTELQFAPFREYLDDGAQRILTGVEINYEGRSFDGCHCGEL